MQGIFIVCSTIVYEGETNLVGLQLALQMGAAAAPSEGDPTWPTRVKSLNML